MENLVITFKYRNGDINQIMSTSDYEKLIQRFGLMELENILLDDEKNCLNVGVNPDQVLIDLYENARLVPVQSQPGTLSSFLGEVYDYKVEGKKLKNILVVSEKPLTFV